MTLQEKRAEWERGLTPMCETEQPEHGRCLVVLRDEHKRYHCHRYFSMGFGTTWECSVDAQGVDADTAIEWAMNPKAMPRVTPA